MNCMKNTASPVEIMTIDDAGHGEGFVVAKEAYVKKLNSFLNKYVE